MTYKIYGAICPTCNQDSYCVQEIKRLSAEIALMKPILEAVGQLKSIRPYAAKVALEDAVRALTEAKENL